jgi:hypothetical protein
MTSGIRPGWLTSARAESGLAERGRDDQVGQRDGRTDRGRPGAQHARVARLDELGGDVDHHVRAGLEVGSDHADRPTAFLQAQPARQVPDRPPGRLGRDVGQRAELAGHGRQPRVVQAQAVQQRVPDAVGPRGPHVLGVRLQHLGRVEAEMVGHGPQRVVQAPVRDAGQAGHGAPRGPGGFLDRPACLRAYLRHGPGIDGGHIYPSGLAGMVAGTASSLASGGASRAQ